MTRFTSDQIAFALAQSGPLDRARAVEFLKGLDIRHSVGHWSAGDFYDRFAPLGYHSDNAAFGNTFEGQCRRTKAAGIDAIEIHQSVFEKTLNGDLDWQAVERAQSGFLAELGLTIPACNINTWTNPLFRLGGPCNPDPALRRAALDEILKAVELCKALKIPVLSVWPGSDGADYHFQIDYLQSLEWFTEALVTVNRACLAAGIKLAIEPKPYEPRELFMIVPTAASAILVARRVNEICGGTNCGLTVDYGHQKMEGTTASTACDLAAYAGIPIHKFDINDARQGRNDQDLIFGTISIPESVDYLFTTFVRDYRGFYSQDQFTYRDDPTRAMERSMVNFANLALKAVRIYARKDELDQARSAGTGPDVLDIISPILVG
ncbi:MAG: TIM barrel protein [Acidobacteria bacterium]|nr:TIM barrel protein [Acidobacteriota bacterium]